MVQPINYGAMALEPLQSGIETGLNLGAAAQQMKERERVAQRQQAFEEARSKAAELYSSGTPEEIAQFSIQYPEFGEEIRTQMQFKSDETRKNMIDSMQEIMINPGNAEQILQRRIAMVQQAGGDPSDTIEELQAYRENPEQFLGGVERAYAFIDPQGYTSYLKTKPEEMTPYQKAQIGLEREKLAVSRSDAALNKELKALEIESKKLDKQLKRETDDLKKQELKQKIEANRIKQEGAAQEKEKSKQQAVTSTRQTLESVNDLLNHPGLKSAVGTSSLIPTVPGTEKADFETALESFVGNLTMENMGVMKGVLSDSDIKMIKSASSGLDPKMSEKAFTERLNKIKDRLNEKLASQGADSQKEPQTYTEGQTATNPQTGERLIFRGGQWQTM